MHTHQTLNKERKHRKGLVSMKLSDTPFFKTTSYFTNPSFFIGKIWTPPFLGKFQKLKPIFIKVPTMFNSQVNPTSM